MTFRRREAKLINGHCSSQKAFGCPTSSFEVLFSTTRQVLMMTFHRRKNTLMMALVRCKLYLVLQLPHMKLNLQWQLSSIYDGVLLSKISVSDSLVDNIVLSMRLFPTDVDGFLPLVIRIYDDFLCFCDKLWPSQISLFFIVRFIIGKKKKKKKKKKRRRNILRALGWKQRNQRDVNFLN